MKSSQIFAKITGIFFVLLFLSFSLVPPTHANQFFENAYKKYPISKVDSITHKNAHTIFKHYGPAAQKGSVASMLLCVMAGIKSKRYNDIYQYLQLLDTAPLESVHLSPREKELLFTRSREAELGVFSLYNILSKLHLLGLGTPQNLKKSQKAAEACKVISPAFSMTIPQEEHFTTPTTPKALMSFWRFTNNFPGAEKFLLDIMKIGASDSKVRTELKKFLATKRTLEDQWTFVSSIEGDFMPKAFGYDMGLLLLQTQEFSKETFEKLSQFFKATTYNENDAKFILDNWPDTLQDSTKLKNLLDFFGKNTNDPIKIPRWMYAYYTNQIDAGILDSPLTSEFSYTISEKEQALIQKYWNTQDKEAFVLPLLKTLDNEPLSEFKMLLFTDTSKNNKALFKKLRPIIAIDYMTNNSLHTYPPFFELKGDEFKNKSLTEQDSTVREQVSQLALQWYARAAEKDYLPGIVKYANMLLATQQPHNMEAYEMLIKAARMGNSQALLRLTLLPNNGNDAKARELDLTTRAAKLGSASAVEKLKARYKIEIPLEKNKVWADLIETEYHSLSLTKAAQELLKQGTTREEQFMGAVLLYYIASNHGSTQQIASRTLAALYYSGKLFPQDFTKAYYYYMTSYNKSGFRDRTCDLILPMIEMYALGLGTAQSFKSAAILIKGHAQCKSPWAKGVANKSIPALAKDAVIQEGFTLQYKPELTAWKGLSPNLTAEEMAKLTYITSSKKLMVAYLKNPQAMVFPMLSTQEKPKETASLAPTSSAPTSSEPTAQKQTQAKQEEKSAAKTLPEKASVSEEQGASPKPHKNVAETTQAPLPTAQAKPALSAPKKLGIALISQTQQDIMSLTAFTADQKPDSCLEVITSNPAPLTAIRIESMGGITASWKTKNVKTSALGVVAVIQNGQILNADDASFSLDVTQESPLTLCVQDNGALADAETRLRVIFYYQDASRAYAIVQK